MDIIQQVVLSNAKMDLTFGDHEIRAVALAVPRSLPLLLVTIGRLYLPPLSLYETQIGLSM
jgi:hypothetical protein